MGNPAFYEVFGKRYFVLTSAEGYFERGVASWYGPGFHEAKTSNGEAYDMYAMTAAHKTLPLPAYVRVRNLDNGRSLVLRVNDRGPFHPGRIIDLSYAAAIKLGVHLTGTAKVEVETLGPRGRARWTRDDARRNAAVDRSGAEVRNSHAARKSVIRRPAAPRVTASGDSRWLVQVGSFGSLANAQRLRDRLRDADIGPVRIDAPDGTEVLHRVRVGPLLDEGDIIAVERRLLDLGLAAVRVRVR